MGINISKHSSYVLDLMRIALHLSVESTIPVNFILPVKNLAGIRGSVRVTYSYSTNTDGDTPNLLASFLICSTVNFLSPLKILETSD